MTISEVNKNVSEALKQLPDLEDARGILTVLVDGSGVAYGIDGHWSDQDLLQLILLLRDEMDEARGSVDILVNGDEVNN